MKTVPKWIQMGGWLVVAIKSVDALVLLTYPVALIPSQHTSVDSLFLAHRIMSTDLALAIIVALGLVKRQPMVLACAFAALVVNEGLDMITLITNYLDGNLAIKALGGAFAAVFFVAFYVAASRRLFSLNEPTDG